MSGLDREVTLTIAAAPEKVWDLVSDVTRIGEFSPETFEARWTHGATGPAVGARFKGHVKRNGVGPTYWSPCTVTKCVEPGSDGTGSSSSWSVSTATRGPTGATGWQPEG